MRDFFELINEYPGTTALLCIFICFVLDTVAGAIRKK